ncbi:MAG TPA: UDP-N-acetylmuramate:L-alanyl-gamma-D-glutamyl-meso-diaminopimelate ligase [Nitrosomonas sp.]|nr:UDP-N-acetylmuramate:L-alanyl-gamma-D-glutamyl-meso-diaminopimelate ligase [Nitrosomonas sp.]HMW69604.1 UDP-N-acetylmuramate:L-alanyl-gamma-D-glutamyl-meso-diaminopimelate ligase [Nitrosomonas sp.]HMY90897.1 UDP-N-acetylmuramate:L-alanyl-gamma-D-glutamyl-meso-diaminopimelate ligase [Nitrosomonas sp.]HNA71265.1 UDP-N-acetylmuramate:L-alanyl-gamma-D-glutamyl-meso-diaminopimelate ligase [Nitrosomonas sp.]HNC40817.1 UDP-N-acetylmuramate:L-alanyl-gamma-D-glutamyl-meso-diaminopimelate ligase [Nitr
MHIHILGICGTFMGGLAVLARESGHKVTGCDLNVYPPMSTQLRSLGIELIEGYSPEQLKLNPDLYVIGNVVTRGNPLMEAILNQNLPYSSGPQWLAEHVLRKRWVLAVAGTHGKTTTSSMLAWILSFAGLDPGFLIGGIPENFGVSARLTGESVSGTNREASPFFVIEADEYDTAFFDKRSKFVHYHPRTLILNNLEYDHADIFPDLASIQKQFHHLIRTVPSNGLIVANGRESSLQQVIAQGCWTPIEFFGVPTEWAVKLSSQGAIEVYFNEACQGTLDWDLLGEHNLMNALAAIAAARHAGVPSQMGLLALSQFKNVKRRMEVKGIVNNITVYDDFAHHPTAIRTTLEGLRTKVGEARIIAVLEPRSNTMKMGVWKDSLAQSLNIADQIFCYTDQVDWDVTSALQSIKHKAVTYSQMQELINAVALMAHAGDHILIMSNGGFGGIHEKLLLMLRK